MFQWWNLHPCWQIVSSICSSNDKESKSNSVLVYCRVCNSYMEVFALTPRNSSLTSRYVFSSHWVHSTSRVRVTTRDLTCYPSIRHVACRATDPVLNSFTVSVCGPNGRQLPAVRAVQGDCKWSLNTVEVPTGLVCPQSIDQRQPQRKFWPANHEIATPVHCYHAGAV